MTRCSTAILLLSLMLLLTACLPVPKHTETPAQTATETAKPTALTPTPATSYEVTMQRATTWVSGTGSQWVQVIAAIENTGSANLYLSSGAYDLEDASGALVGCGSMVFEYPSVLAPGETGYLYETTLLDEPIDIDFSMDKYGDLRIKGRVQNTSDVTYVQTKIVAVLFDADGNLLGLDYTYLDEDLAPGQKVGFELSVMELPESLLEQVADCRVCAYPVQYNW